MMAPLSIHHQTRSMWKTAASLFFVVGVAVMCLLTTKRAFTEHTSTLKSSELKTPPNLQEDSNETIKFGSSSSSSKPNFIFILADDLGWNSIGYENYDLSFATPFLNKMASNGIIMTNHYSQEVCTPARASLLTGRYPLSIGMQYFTVADTVAWGLPLEETTIADVLSKHDYTSYALGKWNLGHYSPRYLPTARGFDYHLGYMTGMTYPWSKKVTSSTKFTDLMYADSSCYAPYDGNDVHKYSTFFYRDKAIDVIKKHNFNKKPMFLYLAFQAVHEPFVDFDHYPSGIPREYVGDETYDYIMDNVQGRKRRQYALSLVLMDRAIASIYEKIKDVKQEDNTYFIFASDNGGCYAAGGKNGPLRGAKGSLYEGGVKTDAFIYSELIPHKLRGTTYDGIMHISDWFPTMLDLGGFSYSPSSGYELDGVSQVTGFIYGSSSNLRTTLLYNCYVNVKHKGNFDIDVNAPCAIRDSQYKLIHAFNGNSAAKWYDYTEANDDDEVMSVGDTCSQSASLKGTFHKYLFDLVNDPYETTNLYHNDAYATERKALYSHLDSLIASSAEDKCPKSSEKSEAAKIAWKEAGNYVVPWIKSSDLKSKDTYPDSCTFKHTAVSPVYDDDAIDDDIDYDDDVSLHDDDDVDDDKKWSDDSRTALPSHKPTHSPTYKPTQKSGE